MAVLGNDLLTLADSKQLLKVEIADVAEVILKGIDDAGNALYPEVNSLESLREKQEKNPYVFAPQYQHPLS